MSNIMINENCNQKCPYCFASEFVNVKKNNISFENFQKAVDFILTGYEGSKVGQIGIIGGEPLLHPKFDEFIKYLIDREDVKKVTVFTNGVLLEKHLDYVLHDKVGVLINVNSPKDVGEDNYNKTVEIIDLLVNKYNKKKRLTIGLNIYDNIDYSFFINLADKYGFDSVRLSIVVPAYGTEKKGIEHFLNLKEKVLEITKALLVRGIRFKFDCNLPVPCIWSKEEIEDLELMGLCSYSRQLIPLEQSVCQPVIDILPDLTAIRCFGLSDISKEKIEDFKDIKELRDYYIEKFDRVISKKPINNKCEKCNLFPLKCYGGCLANRKEN